MSLYEGTHRHAVSGSKAGFDYLLVYAACFAAYLVPVTLRRINARAGSEAQHRHSILGETSALAANCASSSFVGL
ncbi:hypothetical protein [Bradyrhizobium sp.]|uniref:hypothetical protein n=1 Tax=Bradyrhizobium sp. TaxID=376 RepID=UPI0039E247BA